MNKNFRSQRGRRKPVSIALARQAAFETLLRVEEGAYASILLAAKAPTLQPKDRGLCHELVLGVLRRQLWLDHLIEHYSDRHVTSLDPPVRIALRLALYQLRFLSRVPASAAVNESVNLVQVSGLSSARAFVNAVLRRATREPDYDPTDAVADPLARLAVETSHPPWLIAKWAAAFGFSQTEKIASANNEAPPTAFRVVTSRIEERTVLDQLRSAGAELTRSNLATGAWRINGVTTLLLDLAREGLVYMQDESSQMVVDALGLKSGQRVLDLCAAPGGKTSLIASRLNEADLVVATDFRTQRLRSVIANADLQGLSNIVAVAVDGRSPLPFQEASFARVLVDAPCSGTGTLRRNPEIRWRISAGDIQDLSAQQQQLLFNAASAVIPGGRLIYSTCSLEPEENEDVVAAFSADNSDFSPLALPLNSELFTKSGEARTWPHRDGADGFFIAGFQRK